MKQAPMRTCLGCRVKRPKKELVRLTVRQGKLVIDKDHVYGGRGAYLCFNQQCSKQVVKKAVLYKMYNISRHDLDELLVALKSEVTTGCQVR
jgi:predicted RNA-binding protein YlxR (DUF448 family)